MGKTVRYNDENNNGFGHKKHHRHREIIEQQDHGPHGHADSQGKRVLKDHFEKHFWPFAHENKRGHKI